MFYQSVAATALRLFSGAMFALFLTLAMALAASYLEGGLGPAKILAAFILMGCGALAPLFLLLGAAILAVLPPAHRKPAKVTA